MRLCRLLSSLGSCLFIGRSASSSLMLPLCVLLSQPFLCLCGLLLPPCLLCCSSMGPPAALLSASWLGYCLFASSADCSPDCGSASLEHGALMEWYFSSFVDFLFFFIIFIIFFVLFKAVVYPLCDFYLQLSL